VASGIDRQRAGPPSAEPAGGAERAERRRRWLQRANLWALVELFVLTSFAVAQPLLDVTNKSPDLFVFSRAGRSDILQLVVGATLLPVLRIWAGEVLADQPEEHLAGPDAQRRQQRHADHEL